MKLRKFAAIALFGVLVGYLHGSVSASGVDVRASSLKLACREWALAGEPVDLRIESANPSAARWVVTLGGAAAFLPSPAVDGCLMGDSSAKAARVEPQGGRARILFSNAKAEVVNIEIRAEDETGATLESRALSITFLSPGGDEDRDGLTNLQEAERGTDPRSADADADRILETETPAPPVVTASAGAISLPFSVTDVVFDPRRPYVYVSRLSSRKVDFVNLRTGAVEKEFSFSTMPESLAITPDGSRLFVSLLTRSHSSYWFDGTHEGYVASFDLETQVKDREFHIGEDPYDLLATSDGHLVVSSGSGQWTYIRVFDAVTGLETGAVSGVRQQSRLALHTSEGRVYAADTDVTPTDLRRFDLLPGGGISLGAAAPNYSQHRMNGNVWTGAPGDIVVTRGGDLFTSGAAQAADMLYVAGLSAGTITQLAWDGPGRALFTLEGSAVHYYNTISHLEIGGQKTDGAGSFVGLDDNLIYVVIPSGSTTLITPFPNPALGGATNTAPVAHFTISPETGRTTQTDLVFDGSSSTDGEDALGRLQFRWDLDGDGTWDTPFQPSPKVTHRYNTGGTKTVRMQVRDRLALVDELDQTFDVNFEPDAGTPGPVHPPFELPFQLTDAVFDPLRPYLYVSRKDAKKLDVVNLETGLVEREFSFQFMPESLAVSPDGSRLYVALLAREHDQYWMNGTHEGYVASLDLVSLVKDREFHITEDPFDLVATSGGGLLVTSGSGQWSYIRTFNAEDGSELSAVSGLFAGARLALHPTEGFVYCADTQLGPPGLHRYSLTQGGGLASAWTWPYNGEHRLGGNVWASPLGDVLVGQGGDVFTVGTTQATDMLYAVGMSAGTITQLAWDVPRFAVLTLEGSSVHYYNLVTRLEIGSQLTSSAGSFIGIHGDSIYVTMPASTSTHLEVLARPVPEGAANTPPVARFTIDPAAPTTQTVMAFDASPSTDAEDTPSDLQFRWDLDNDGTWDGPFQPIPTAADGCALPFGNQSFDVVFAPDPGAPGPAHAPFTLPFVPTDVLFDPVRPYLYASDKAAKKVYFVNLSTGMTERVYEFAYMPESVAIAPDGSRLYVALLTRAHTCCWDSATQEGYVASFDLATQVKDREYRITLDPYDLVVPSAGHLVVPSGSDQWTLIKVFDAATGLQTGVTGYDAQQQRMVLHPSEARVYAATNNVSPTDIGVYTLLPGGTISSRQGSPYHGEHRMEGNVWASPTGDYVVTRGGDIFTSSSTPSADMRYVSALSVGTITQLAWDGPGRTVFTLEGSTLHDYNLISHLEIGSQALSGAGSFVGLNVGQIYVTIPSGAATQLVSLPHPAPGGSTNTAPVARFTISPPAGGTTVTDFIFDASSSTDAEDGLPALQFRWDFDNDGTWDTPFQSTPAATHRYPTTGTKTVRMQVRDHLALAADIAQSFDVPLAPDAGVPGPSHAPFALPFQVTDAIFDPARPYLYASEKASKKVYFVNLLTGLTDRVYTFDYMPESLALAPDGSRLYVALLTREHSSSWSNGTHEGYVDSFDLATRVKDRHVHIAEDPFDFVATSDGHLVVASGSGGSSTYIRVFDAVSGQQTGSVSGVRELSRLTLHPSESKVYVTDTTAATHNIKRYDLSAAGVITARWSSPYTSGQHRMGGNVWASPQGDQLIAGGGDIFTAGTAQSADIIYVAGLSAGTITQATWDIPRQVVFTVEGSSLHYYNPTTRLEFGSQALSGAGSFVGLYGDRVYATIPGTTTTQLESYAHPAPGGATNTAPAAAFSISPAAGRTTLTDLTFDASSSTDGQEPSSSLVYRWDLENDGVWDTPFQSTPVVTRRYISAGARTARLQVRDSLGLTGDMYQSFNVAFAPDPGSPAPPHTPFALPFQVTDAAFDPVRPYVYASEKAAKKVYFVNLLTGLTERVYTFAYMPESMTISPDGSRLFVSLLTRDHSSSWSNGTHEGYVASFDLATQVKDRELYITEDPYDLLATSDGHLVVASGSGQWTYVRIFDAVTAQQTGAVSAIRQLSHLTLHPSQGTIYAADTDSSPSDLRRLDLSPAGVVTAKWAAPEHGLHRMNGNVWASPLGDVLITRGGDVFTAGTTQATDMVYISALSAGTITDLAWSTADSSIYTIEGSSARVYDLTTRQPRATYTLAGAGSFVGAKTGQIFVLVPGSGVTNLQTFMRATYAPVKKGTLRF